MGREISEEGMRQTEEQMRVIHGSKWRSRDRKWYNDSSSALEKTGEQWQQETLSFFLRGER